MSVAVVHNTAAEGRRALASGLTQARVLGTDLVVLHAFSGSPDPASEAKESAAVRDAVLAGPAPHRRIARHHGGDRPSPRQQRLAAGDRERFLAQQDTGRRGVHDGFAVARSAGKDGVIGMTIPLSPARVAAAPPVVRVASGATLSSMS